MRVIFFGNNWVGWQQLCILKQHDCELVGLVVHPQERSRFRRHHLEAAGLPSEQIFDASSLHNADTLAALTHLQPDIAFCGCFGFILREPLLRLFPKGCVNSHISLLPFNRGAYPNVWSIVEKTPAGVSLHYIDAGVDTGPLLAQREVQVEPTDTGQSLYLKLERAAVELFRTTLPSILRDEVRPRMQTSTGATAHKVADVKAIDRIDLNQQVRAGDLIDLLRARTFPPFRGAYFVHNGQRIYLRLSMEAGESEE